MSVLEAILLGFLQGISEFLPVSSSGHLVLAERSFGIQPEITLNVFLHMGTLGAIISYYHRDLLQLLRDSFHVMTGRIKGEERAFLFKLVLATGVTATLGLFLEAPIERLFSQPQGYLYLGGTFFVTFLLLACLWFLPTLGERGGEITYTGALIIGVVQGLAVFPGISRSGSTIVVALLLGMGGKEAARFSFLLAIPVIAGAGLLKARNLVSIPHVGALALGVLTAFVVGLASLVFLVKIVERGKMAWFALYVLPLSLGVLAFGR